jgi:CheY-like chemotaxis protein
MISTRTGSTGTDDLAKRATTAKIMEKLHNVLLIDDDEIFIFLTGKMLQSTGSVDSITVFRSGKQALEFLFRHCNGDGTPDIIFLDLNMPEMTGWDFLEEYQHYLRRCRRPPKLYIVSSSTATSDEARAMKIPGVSGYLPKPLHTEGIRTMLRMASLRN